MTQKFEGWNAQSLHKNHKGGTLDSYKGTILSVYCIRFKCNMQN